MQKNSHLKKYASPVYAIIRKGVYVKKINLENNIMQKQQEKIDKK